MHSRWLRARKAVGVARVCVPVWVVGGGVEDQHHVVEEHVVERWSMCTVHTIKQRMS
jgi:hypothetical protein